ncbi:hypothetical protein NCC78_11805 [Micromonospora phytophila]|uniref:hypothetical protein n=1 Tax=Micromonospora phytophila TaxID=709888 RepID=UPI00202FE807|nr:hypothetical protein [Micromonospora phytophila]MCM0675367.1 hypothetical protein [Micromonospora phytophila]
MGYVAGMIPGDAARATVDHCYVTYDRQERLHSRCVGHWTRAGRVVSGPVKGVDVSQHWQALTVDPGPNYEWEVNVPEAARHQVAVAHHMRAYVVPRFVPILLVVLELAAVGLLGWVAVSGLRRRAGAA